MLGCSASLWSFFLMLFLGVGFSFHGWIIPRCLVGSQPGSCYFFSSCLSVCLPVWNWTGNTVLIFIWTNSQRWFLLFYLFKSIIIFHISVWAVQPFIWAFQVWKVKDLSPSFPCDTVILTTYSFQLCIDVTLITKEEMFLIKMFKNLMHMQETIRM